VNRPIPIWAALAGADRFTSVERDRLATWAIQAARDNASRAAIVTCHRVELYGLGEQAFPQPPTDGPAPLRLEGDDVVRHAARLAAGLESAVLGEDQVLAQVRSTLADLTRTQADPRLVRLFEAAVSAGRRARAGYAVADRDLGEAAARWLETTGGPLADRPVVVAGSGVMGRLLAAAMARRDARITVASRSLEHARRLADRVGGRAVALRDGTEAVAASHALAVALAGTWPELTSESAPRYAVDLSFPAALPAAVRDRIGDRHADVDALYADVRGRSEASALEVGFIRRAETIVEETVDAYRHWLAGRDSVPTLRTLRARAEERRTAELERLLRRLPDLDPQQVGLLEAFSERLVAGLLHEPSAALRDDLDGTAASAARQLFRL
jgi:glutamyl-tRNA reductase